VIGADAPSSYLEGLAHRYGTDKLVHGYCPHYVRHLAPIRRDPISLLEVGVYHGASLLMWRDWMPNARILGVDIDPAAMMPRIDRLETRLHDVRDPWPDDEMFEVIIDEGGHTTELMIASWGRLWPHVKPGGWFIIEDWATQWMTAYNRLTPEGLPSSMVDGLDRHLHDVLLGHPTPHDDDATRIVEFHAYLEIVFLRKGTA
jgi:cephalosporin hydroxylase